MSHCKCYKSVSYYISITFIISAPVLISTWISQQAHVLIICSLTHTFPLSWRRKWKPTPVFLPGEFYGQKSLGGYSLWGRKESDTTERLLLHCHFSFLCLADSRSEKLSSDAAPSEKSSQVHSEESSTTYSALRFLERHVYRFVL